jgi:hypothetical protein
MRNAWEVWTEKSTLRLMGKFSRNLSPVSPANEKCMGNVDGKVDAEADRDDEAVAGDHVDGEAPEVHEPRHVDDGGCHTEEDDASTRQAEQKQ